MQTKHLTLGGILTALTLIFLYFSVIFKTNSLTFLTLASFMVPIALMKANFDTACIVFISSSLLAFLLVPLNTALIYALFFGIYGLVKYFIEKLQHLPLEIILKLTFFNSLLVILAALMHLQGYAVFNNAKLFIEKYVSLNAHYFSFILIGCGMQLAFLAFDYGLTLLIDYYNRYIPHSLKR